MTPQPDPSAGAAPLALRATRRLARVGTGRIALLAAAVWLVSGAVMFHFGASWHLDLRVYRAAGSALYHGRDAYVGDFTANHLPFTYPPFALLVLSPLSLGRLGPVEGGWWLLGAASIVTATFLVLRQTSSLDVRRAWSVAALLAGACSLGLEPLRSNFDYGQIEAVLVLVVVADLLWMPRRGRGVLVGLAAAIKLTPLAFLLSFVADRDWRALVRAVVVVGATLGLSWAVLPGESSRYWLHEAFDAGRTGPLGGVSNQSWNGMVHRAPFNGGHLGTAVWLVLSLATLAVGAFLAFRLVPAGRRAEATFALALTELLVSPVSWSHHWTWLVVAPVVAVALWRRRRPVAVAVLVLFALGVVAPYLWPRQAPFSWVTANALVLGGAVVLVLWALAEWRAGPGEGAGDPSAGADRDRAGGRGRAVQVHPGAALGATVPSHLGSPAGRGPVTRPPP